MNTELVMGVGEWVRVVLAFTGVLVCILLAVRLFQFRKDLYYSQWALYGGMFFIEAGVSGRIMQNVLKYDQPYSQWFTLMFIGQTMILAYLLEPRGLWAKRIPLLGSLVKEPE